MSDSEADLPSEDTISRCLQQIVARLWREQNLDELTVKRVRLSAEKQLGLPDDFLKSDTWAKKSKQVISDAVSKQESQADAASSPAPSPQRSKAKAKAPETKTSSAAKRGTGQDSVDPSPVPKKRRKQEVEDGSDSAAEEAEERQSLRDESEADEDSDMSSLIDEAPKPRKSSKAMKKVTGGPAAKASLGKGKTKSAAELSPTEAEIKRLQGWLLKCGIRKLWHRELAPHGSDKAKIAHLKRLLADAGMDGRYSVEKARHIKEQRELAADLEAVQEGNKMWGQSDSEEQEQDGAAGRPRRRLAKGLQDLGDFMDDAEDESD